MDDYLRQPAVMVKILFDFRPLALRPCLSAGLPLSDVNVTLLTVFYTLLQDLSIVFIYFIPGFAFLSSDI